jgi:hypothetical protein
MSNFIEMTEDEWYKTYKPIKNHIDTNASFDGYMFETYDEEVEFVKSQDPAHIWMYGDGDDGGGYIWNGWHFVNRIGYFITEVPCPADVTIQVLISVPCYFCENCGEEMDDPDNLIRDAFQDEDLEKCPHCVRLDEMTPAILKAMEPKE